jgi:inosine/xanthosine triphosphatase
MRVAVGTGNPVKVAATRAALARADRTTSVESVPVDSGVSEQPFGREETVEGARTRARRCLDGQDLGVGIEGGVTDDPAVPGLALVMYAVVTDGDRVGVGAGPALTLPESIADRGRDGEELGPVMDDVLDTTGVKHDQGAAGVLTDGATDRQDALRTGVACALAPFLTGYYE